MALRDFALLMLVCLLWAMNNIVSKYAVGILDAPPLAYATVRFAVVALAVFPWLWPIPRPLGRTILVSLLMGGGTFSLMFMALATASPSAVAIVSQVMLPFTVFLSFVMLGERLSRRRVAGMALTLAGVVAVMWDPRGLTITASLLYVVASSFLGSLGAVMMKQMPAIRPLQFQAWVGVSSFVPLAVLTAVLEPGQVAIIAGLGGGFWAAVLFSGLVVSVGAHTLYYMLIQRYEATLISPLTMMTPLATIGLGVLITHDHFDVRMAIGAALALAGVLIIAMRPNQLMTLLIALRNRAP